MQDIQYDGVRALRGVAAMMVVIYHITVRIGEYIGYSEDGIYSNLSSGVDIFFVISGFVMIISSQPLRKKDDGWRIFMRRRLIRIVPLYWILTSLKIVLVIAAGHGALTTFNIIASYLFLPSRDATGEIKTVLPPGWTLSFEMSFYIFFAIALATRIKPISLLAPIAAIVAVLSLFRKDEWPAVSLFLSMFPLEFVFRMAIGLWALHGRKIRPTLAIVLLTLGFVCILSLPLGPIIGAAQEVGRISLRVLTWGVPAAVIVVAIVSLEGKLKYHWAALELGDASYSIYLTHGFFLSATPWILKHAPWPIVAVGMAIVCALGGAIVWRLAENPLLATMKAWTSPLAARSDRFPATEKG